MIKPQTGVPEAPVKMVVTHRNHAVRVLDRNVKIPKPSVGGYRFVNQNFAAHLVAEGNEVESS